MRNNNYENNRILKFNITFFSQDVTLIKKVNKILTKQPSWTRIKDSDINYNLVVKSAVKFVSEYGRDSELIKDLREKCLFEIDRIKRNSLTNVKRREQGKEPIVNSTISIGFTRKSINSLFAIMKNEIQIEGLILEVFIHSIALYYANRVVRSYEDKPNKRFKNNFEIRREQERHDIIKEETKNISEFKTFSQAEEEQSDPVVQPKEESQQQEQEEEIEANPITLMTKRDKKKLKKEINNLAHSMVFEDFLEREKTQIENLQKEKEMLRAEISKLHLEYEESINKINEAKELFRDLSEAFMAQSIDAENLSNSFKIDDKPVNIFKMNRVISARKMRGMDTKKQERELENLLA